MEFFDKKQDVIDLKLTRYGRQLLSVGEFEPAFYAFSDDGVLYDSRWVDGTTAEESQWLVEQRIQEETPRLQTIPSKLGAERTIFNTADISAYALDKNLIDLFNLGTDTQDLAELQEYKSGKLTLDADFADSEKLLVNLLGTKRSFNNKAPGWNVLFYSGDISSSSDRYQKNGISAPIPQLNADLTDVIYRVPETMKIDDLAVVQEKFGEWEGTYGTLQMESDQQPWHGEEEQFGYFFQHYDGLWDGSVLVDLGSLFMSFEESHVDFDNENFTLEVFQVTETGDSKYEDGLKKLIFEDPNAPNRYPVESDLAGAIFQIKTDGEVEEFIACPLINSEKGLRHKSLYVSDVYNCEGIDAALKEQAEDQDPYNLPAVDTEDVC